MSKKDLTHIGTLVLAGGAGAFVAENFVSALKTPQIQTLIKYAVIAGAVLLILGMFV